jgi:hypothetical protein
MCVGLALLWGQHDTIRKVLLLLLPLWLLLQPLWFLLALLLCVLQS